MIKQCGKIYAYLSEAEDVIKSLQSLILILSCQFYYLDKAVVKERCTLTEDKKNRLTSYKGSNEASSTGKQGSRRIHSHMILTCLFNKKKVTSRGTWVAYYHCISNVVGITDMKSIQFYFLGIKQLPNIVGVTFSDLYYGISKNVHLLLIRNLLYLPIILYHNKVISYH